MSRSLRPPLAVLPMLTLALILVAVAPAHAASATTGTSTAPAGATAADADGRDDSSASDPHAGMAAMHAEHERLMGRLDALDARLDALVTAMNAAKGQAKVDATAAVVAELVAQRKELRDIAMDGLHLAMEFHGHGGTHHAAMEQGMDGEMSCCAGMAEGKGASCCQGEKAAGACTDQDAKTCATAGLTSASAMAACCKAHAGTPAAPQSH